MAKGNALIARIIKGAGKYRLEIENTSDEVVTDIEISTAGFKYADQPTMQVRFGKGLRLPAKATGIVEHEVLVDKDGKWAQSTWYDGDMLKYLPEAELRDELDVYYLVNGEIFPKPYNFRLVSENKDINYLSRLAGFEDGEKG